MTRDQEAQGVPSDLLAEASQLPANVKLEAYNPMENIPTLAVGDDFTEGMTVSGYYEETQVIASPKFKFSTTRNEKGIPTQLRHVLRIGSPTGKRLGIWTCGELRVAFEKLTPGSFISIAYEGKGENAKNQEQHFFKLSRSAPALNS